MTPLRCAICGNPLAIKGASLGYFDPATGRAPVGPDAWRTADSRYLCDDCESSDYRVDLERLVRDGLEGPNGWITHLNKKVWWHPLLAIDLYDAYDAALAMPGVKAPEPPKQSVRRARAKKGEERSPRSISARVRASVMERDGFRCRRCGCGPDVSRLVIDHIQPVAKGGKGDITNLQTLCQPCNAGKRDREPHDHDRGGAE